MVVLYRLISRQHIPSTMAKVTQSGKYELLTVSGSSPYERGYAYGAHFTTKINGRVQYLYNYFDKAHGLSKSEVEKRALAYAKTCEDYSPDVFAEIKGTAAGANVTMSQIFIAGAYGELNKNAADSACTSFAARDAATEDGLTYVGQNNDERLSWTLDGEGETVAIFKQKTGPDAMVYTYAGAPVLMGINSAGLSVCLNGIPNDKNRPGVNVLCVVREVLNQKNLGDAIDAIERAKLASAINFMIGTPKEIADIEANPSHIEVIRSDEMITHANHYVCPTKGVTVNKESHGHINSCLRGARMEELMQANKGTLTLDKFETFLMDHQNRPDSICAHVDKSKPAWHQGMTVDGMVFISEKKEAWIAKGPPCDTQFVKYAFN
jgi:isopenicillin-N N-acyltransferase like protein